MEVGSPENGFDEISDLFKHDESSIHEDLDLSFLVNKDVAADYAFDDLEGEDKFNFHFSEQGQSELPSLLSNFRYYDPPGPSVENFQSAAQTGGSSIDVLLDTDAADVVSNKENLQIRSTENHQYDDTEKLCAGYLRDSASQVDLESTDYEVPQVVCRHPQLLASKEDLKLEVEIVDLPDSPRDNVGEETFAKTALQELHQSEFASREEEDVPVHKIETLHLSPSTYLGDEEYKSGNVNDSRNSRDGSKELDSPHIEHHQESTSHFSASAGTTGEISVSPETSSAAIQVHHDQRLSSSHGLQDALYSNIPHDRECSQAECCDPGEDFPSLDHSLLAGVENCASSDGLMKGSQHREGSPGKHVDTPQINHQGVKRSRSQSPVGQRYSSSRHKRDSQSNSEARFAYSRGWLKRSSDMAACSYQSSGSLNRCVNREGHKDLSNYYKAWNLKDDFARRSDRGREVTSKDHLPVTDRQNSAARRESRRRFRDNSSSKRSPASLSNHSSQHRNHRKVELSGSPSPASRRNLKRERDKSQSRSPCARDYYRKSSRKRYSPRHRSPSRSYSFHNRSLQVRYLSPASYRRTGIGQPGTCLFVAGFGFSTTERELERKFSRFGRVSDVRIIHNKRSGLSRGYGFLSLEKDEEADAAIRALHKTDWNGRVILVEKSIK